MNDRTIFRVVLGYAAMASTWILFSDTALYHAWPEAAVHFQFGLLKGLAFVAITALILYWLLRRLTLAESDWYRAFFENNHAVMLLIDPANGDIVDANPAAAKFYGWPRERLRSMCIGDINALSKAEVDAALKHAQKLESTIFHFRHQLANGALRDVEVSSGQTTMRGKRLLYSIIHDVTERDRAEAQLRRQKSLYAALAEINHAVIHLPGEREIFDQVCRTAVERGGFLFAWIGIIDAITSAVTPVARYGEDRGYLDAARVSIDAALPIGRGPAGMAVRENQSIVINDFLTADTTRPWHDLAQRAGVLAAGAFPIRRSGRAVAVLNVYATSPGYFDDEIVSTLETLAADVSFALDNAEHRRREAEASQALAESEQRFRQVTENIREVFFLVDPEMTQMHYVSPGYLEIWGRSCESLYVDPRSFADGIHIEDREQAIRTFAPHGKVIPFDTEYRVVRPDGAVRWVRAQGFPIRNESGDIYRYAGVAEDITERKQGELATNSRLKRVQRQMEAIGRISRSDALLTGDVERLSREITEEASRVTAVERANVWQFNDNENELRCIDLYVATQGTHESGSVLQQKQFENEFQALRITRYVDADDAMNDPRTAGYAESYLKPLRITSMLDAVVHVSGRNLGLLCLEHVDHPHHWESDEISFACQLADKIAVAMAHRTRLAAQSELAQSEQRYRSMIEQTVSGFYLIQDGVLVYVNTRFAEIFGYASPGEVIGRSPMELVAKQDHALVTENIRRRLDGEIRSVSYEFTGLRKDGTRFTVGTHGSLATHEGRPAIIGLLQDVTEKARAEETIRDYISRLERAMLGTVDAVSKMVELRDPYTSGHEQRVGELAAAIAAEMDLDPNMQQGLRIAGGVHDIGKIVVPAEILSKPGRLNAIEYEMVKGHAQQGYEVLKNIDFPWPVAEVARQHHERIDGSGYPRGLKGDEIILEARILAVADVVESMASHRPYRPGLGIDKALEEIERGAGRLYDPQAAAACLRLFRGKGYALPD